MKLFILEFDTVVSVLEVHFGDGTKWLTSPWGAIEVVL